MKKMITLLVDTYGRGIDFNVLDEEVNSLGGLLVIQTYLSRYLSDEIQILGRTGRQGKNGGYLCIYTDSHLQIFPDMVSDMEDFEDWLQNQRNKLDEENSSLVRQRVDRLK